ncbi:MAG: VanW family protein [Fimbriimonadales bacterium]|nr:VanW family protein [Fimbriimonadales bacterium]
MRHTKKAVFVGLGALVVAGGGFFAYGSLQPATTPEGVRLGEVELGGLTRPEVLQRLEAWWDAQRQSKIQPRSNYLTTQPSSITLEESGVQPDWDATLSNLRFTTYFDRTFGRTVEPTEISIVWKLVESTSASNLAKFVEQNAKPATPASISFEGGKIVRKYEVPAFKLDVDRVGDAMLAAIETGEETFELPLKKDAPTIPNDALDKIQDVMAEFTTSFSEGQYNRSSNIRLACKALDGIILMPGEELSYNKVVGRRTAANGYKEAPVFKNGMKVLDNGGGVCQVSTTMYNAALLADLEIVKRMNHSRPVAYVPVGRDATVDYGSGVDLVIKNQYDFPIAVISRVDGGKVSFWILGRKDPTKSIAIITTDHKAWGNTVKYVDDPSLPPGKETVVDSGAGGRSCITWRIVKVNGNEIRRDNLGRSYYAGAARIIARNPTPAAPDGQPLADPNKTTTTVASNGGTLNPQPTGNGTGTGSPNGNGTD